MSRIQWLNFMNLAKAAPASVTAEVIHWQSTLGHERARVQGRPLSYYRLAAIEQALVFAGQGNLSTTATIPAGAQVAFAQMNYDTALVLAGGATNVAVGTAATVNAFALSGAAVLKNTKTNARVVEANKGTAAAVAVQVTASNGAGAATGTITSGTVRVRVLYEYVTDVTDAP